MYYMMKGIMYMMIESRGQGRRNIIGDGDIDSREGVGEKERESVFKLLLLLVTRC